MAGGLETELLVEGDGAVVIDIDIEHEFGAASHPRSLRGSPDQLACQTRASMRVADVEITDSQPVRSVEDGRRPVDLGRNETGEVGVWLDERVVTR